MASVGDKKKSGQRIGPGIFRQLQSVPEARAQKLFYGPGFVVGIRTSDGDLPRELRNTRIERLRKLQISQLDLFRVGGSIGAKLRYRDGWQERIPDVTHRRIISEGIGQGVCEIFVDEV